MNENEVSIRKNDEIITVNIDEVPEIIAGQIDAISKLGEKVSASEESAKTAMEYVNKQMTRYEEKGKGIFKHRAGNTKDIIEDTQEAITELASAQQVTVEALSKSVGFQKKLAEVSKFLFELGCANITVNRIAVRAIEAKLTGASKETISELAKQEMMAVVRQLKEQEDILIKQEELQNKVKKNTKSISNIESSLKVKDALDEKQSKQIDSLNEAMENKDKIDAEQTQRLEELRALLDNKDLVDQKQEYAITSNREDIDKLKGTLEEKNALDNLQSERISKNEEAIQLIYAYMKQKDEIDQKQTKEIEKLSSKKSKLSIVSLIISSIALIMIIMDLILRLNS